MMKRKAAVFLVGAVVGALSLVGCSGQASAACPPVIDGVGVCIDAKPIAWSAGVKPPHMHENGGYYGAVNELATALGAKAEVAGDGKSVKVGGKVVAATAADAKGIHLHEEFVYVPIKEFAEAAGYKVYVDTGKHTVNIWKE
ncbi:MAG TPA: hypothetical protein VD902_14405 [Symbiobacteriaceae bacterium]|nr:hypothetical protein [Symbiobacteriaceae bacterium]